MCYFKNHGKSWSWLVFFSNKNETETDFSFPSWRSQLKASIGASSACLILFIRIARLQYFVEFTFGWLLKILPFFFFCSTGYFSLLLLWRKPTKKFGAKHVENTDKQTCHRDCVVCVCVCDSMLFPEKKFHIRRRKETYKNYKQRILSNPCNRRTESKKELTLNYILINSDLVRAVHHSQKRFILGEFFFYALRFMPTAHWFILLMV